MFVCQLTVAEVPVTPVAVAPEMTGAGLVVVVVAVGGVVGVVVLEDEPEPLLVEPELFVVEPLDLLPLEELPDEPELDEPPPLLELPPPPPEEAGAEIVYEPPDVLPKSLLDVVAS